MPEPYYDSTKRASLLEACTSIWRSRSLLGLLARQELTLRYRRSFIGFLWSLATPIVSLVIYSFALTKIIKISIPDFAVFVWAGLIVWNTVLNSMSTATSSVVRSWGLVSKVSFQRQTLPIAAVLASLSNMLIQLGMILVVAVLVGRPVKFIALPILLLAATAILLILTGVGLLTAAANVYIRDTQYIVDVGLVGVFWLTPIIYAFQASGFTERFQTLLYLNPLTPIVLSFQNVIYGNPRVGTTTLLPEWTQLEMIIALAYPLLLGVVMVTVGMHLFNRLQLRFADEL